MSQGPVSTKPFKPTKYYNTEVTPKDWCHFKGQCPVALGTYLGNNPCHVCIFRGKVDIPRLLEERNKK
jgi:hypothetical protein